MYLVYVLINILVNSLPKFKVINNSLYNFFQIMCIKLIILLLKYYVMETLNASFHADIRFSVYNLNVASKIFLILSQNLWFNFVVFALIN